nr:hypothetical protein [Tanacetum cinerariifolium]
QKCVLRSLMMGRGVPNLAKRDFRNFQATQALWANIIQSQTPSWQCSWGHDVPGGSIVESLENVNGFLAVYIHSDDLIHTDFEQKGVVPKVMLHIFEEFVLLLGRHSLNNEIPRMNLIEQSRLGFFLSKDIFEGGVIRIHNAFVHDEKTGHRSGYLLKAFFESSIAAGMTKKAMDILDGSGMR